jgi:exopolyphosphatase/pppGpp-phosphohydrolase
MKKVLSIFVFILTIASTFGQDVKIPAGSTLAMYVEFGGKGIKLGVLAFTDAKYRKYTPIENKEFNVGLSKSIQSTGKLTPQDISSATSAANDGLHQMLDKFKPLGLKDGNVYFYASSGIGVASNVGELADAVKSKTGYGMYVVKEAEEAKYTIAGTIPYEKIDAALVLDQGGSNTKGGYVIQDGSMLVGVPVTFDLGSVRISDLIVSNYMTSQPDEQDEYRKVFVDGMNKCFDSLKLVIKRTFANIQGVEDRNELYLSGGAAYVITTLLYPEFDLNTQMVPVEYSRLKNFLISIQDRDYYKALKDKTFENEKMQKNYKSALGIYSQLQLISATKLLLTYVQTLGGDEKKIYFNRYGLHSMPSMLMGKIFRNEIKKW